MVNPNKTHMRMGWPNCDQTLIGSGMSSVMDDFPAQIKYRYKT